MDTQDKILRSALKIFTKRGFSASTSSITKDAGLSAGILFHYYRTKNDLIVALYAKFRLEQYQVQAWTVERFPKRDRQEFLEELRAGWTRTIDWGLDHWPKFQYIQLFDSSVLAHQFQLADNKEIEALFHSYVALTELAVANGYFKDLPVMYIVHVTHSLLDANVEYLHGHPQYRPDPSFAQQTWQAYCDLILR